MRRHRLLTYIAPVLTALLLSLTACDDTTFGSSVPRLSVNIRIDLRQGPFVTFTPENTSAYVTANREGFYLNGKYAAPALDTDYFGYGGVLIYVSMNGYNAYDLACPYCAAHGYCHTCAVNSSSAICPVCGEEYQLWAGGMAYPTKGITREPLLQLPLTVTDYYIIVRQ